MSERFRFMLFIIFSITILWFTIILLCLPQSDQFDQRELQQQTKVEQIPEYNRLSRSYLKIEPPKSPEFMRFFHPRKLTHIETIFYQFNPVLSLESINLNGSVTKSQHEKDTLGLNSINNPTDQLVKDEGYRLFAFNLLSSNRIGLSRSLPDTRPVKCPRALTGIIPASKQQIASIIICYYNEAPSALLRTIYSIINRTPIELIGEIIIVDDFSESGYDMEHVRPHLNSLPHHDLIKFLRTSKREGLIRARLFGANHATGEVLVFLDSHVEANIGWLEPLLQLLQDNKTTIVCPMIDLINADTMIYSASPMVRGGLTWALHFRWDSIPAEDLKTYDDFAKPVRSASMAGGLYAINRDFFNHLGAYDSGMNLWGGENIELSLRAWMCGGRILVVPCSRLGHIFRKTRPYSPGLNEPDSLLYNSHRSARVWLDEEHLDKFYELSPDARSLDSGDISRRLEIRMQLRCKNFTWFLDNIYPALKSELAPNIGAGEKDEVKQKRNLFLASSKRVDRSIDARLSRRRRHKLGYQAHPNVVGPAESRRLSGFARKYDPHYHEPRLQSISRDDLRPVNMPLTFLSNFYPPRKSPKIISTFQIQLVDSNLCIESKTSFMAQEISRLVLDDCAPMTAVLQNKSENLVPDSNNSSSKGSLSLPPLNIASTSSYSSLARNQLWSETELHDYRLGPNRCLDIMKNLPILRKCSNMRTFQAWSHLNYTLGTYISDYSSGEMCLAVERVQRGEPVIVTICDRERNDGDNSLDSLRLLEVAPSTRSKRFLFQRREQRSTPIDKIYSARDVDGGSWLTGPLPLSKPFDHHAHYQQLVASPYFSSKFTSLNQRWNLIPV